LLVESSDIALMNIGVITEAIAQAYERSLPAGVDQVWFADTSFPADVEFHDLSRWITTPANG
jgi:hypothetical protein